jgi:hypothetical protein
LRACSWLARRLGDRVNFATRPGVKIDLRTHAEAVLEPVRWTGLVAGIRREGGRVTIAQAPATPDARMMAAPENLARFIETLDATYLVDVFASRDVSIIENFAPYRFAGPRAVDLWTNGMRSHLDGLSGLRHAFGDAKDFSQTGNTVYFALPTQWTGLIHGKPFSEEGGWAFVLARNGMQWRVQTYAWVVVKSTTD